MKYLIVVPDGAADDPVESLGGKTPLETGPMAFANHLAARGLHGLVRTIPPGIAPGSDAANLSVMGYDPSRHLTGRSPLEAASIGIEMSPEDVAFRTNLITLKGEGPYEEKTILDHSAGDITTEEARQLIEAVQEAFGDREVAFYAGVSYRHCMIWHGGSTDCRLIPPHDVLGKKAGDFLPEGDGAEKLTDMMKKSYDLLSSHPINRKREEKGLNPANTLWIWGQGRKPSLPSFSEKYGITGAAISAVDLIKGIAVCAGLDSVSVDGVTGTVDTNYQGKARAAIDQFRAGTEFVYVHVEGPDECSHQGDPEGKLEALRRIDQRILKPVFEYLSGEEEPFRILIVPDHRTPLRIRTHSSDPVPFVIYDSRKAEKVRPEQRFDETSGASGRFFESGTALADFFFSEG